MKNIRSYPSRLKNNKICPRCGKRGFLIRRWVRASYYPRYSNVDILYVEQKIMNEPNNREKLQSWLDQLGNGISKPRYWGHVRPTRPSHSEMREGNYYRVVTKRYYYRYFGHYDEEKYRQQMIDYRNGRRKSRPNGRKWCKVSAGANDRRKSWF